MLFSLVSRADNPPRRIRTPHGNLYLKLAALPVARVIVVAALLESHPILLAPLSEQAADAGGVERAIAVKSISNAIMR